MSSCRSPFRSVQSGTKNHPYTSPAAIVGVDVLPVHAEHVARVRPQPAAVQEPPLVSLQVRRRRDADQRAASSLGETLPSRRAQRRTA